jgi:hypothetical protein
VQNIAAWTYKAIDEYIRQEENKQFTPAEEISSEPMLETMEKW